MSETSATPAPVVRASLADQLAERVLQLIEEGKLKAGDRLPSVNALAERFSVAKPTLREALRRLEAMGAIDIRHGSGVYVHPNFERLMLINPYYGALEVGTVLELLDARLLIEPALAEMAARRLEDDDLAELDDLLDEAERQLAAASRDDGVLQEVNRRFHSKIAALSGNAVLSQMVISLHDLHLQEQIEIFYLYNDPADDHRQHKAILEALRERKPNKARRRMAKHVETVKSVVESGRKGGAS